MSEPHPNGNGRTTSRILATVPERLIKALPAGFVVLIVLNICFLAVATFVFGHNTEARNTMLAKILDRCLEAPR
jgi:hypothetical protein